MSDQDTSASAEQTGGESSADEVLESIDSGLEEVVDSEEVEASDEGIEASDATEEELAEVIGDEDASEEEVQEAAFELKRRMTFKVNGKDVEKDIDLSDIEAIQELLQKGFAADEKFQQSSATEKKMKQLAQSLQDDPMKALKAAGLDPDKVAETYMEKRIKDLQKSPEQKQLEDLQKQVEEERHLREALEQEKVSAEQSRAQEEYSRHLDTEITDALDSSTLPKSPYVVKRIAENLMIALEQGNEDVAVKDILPVVEKQINGELRQMFEAMPEDVIEKILGNDVSSRLRKRRIKKMKKTPEGAANVKPTGQSETKKAAKDKEVEAKKSAADFFKNF